MGYPSYGLSCNCSEPSCRSWERCDMSGSSLRTRTEYGTCCAKRHGDAAYEFLTLEPGATKPAAGTLTRIVLPGRHSPSNILGKPPAIALHLASARPAMDSPDGIHAGRRRLEPIFVVSNAWRRGARDQCPTTCVSDGDAVEDANRLCNRNTMMQKAIYGESSPRNCSAFSQMPSLRYPGK